MKKKVVVFCIVVLSILLVGSFAVNKIDDYMWKQDNTVRFEQIGEKHGFHILRYRYMTDEEIAFRDSYRSYNIDKTVNVPFVRDDEAYVIKYRECKEKISSITLGTVTLKELIDNGFEFYDWGIFEPESYFSYRIEEEEKVFNDEFRSQHFKQTLITKVINDQRYYLFSTKSISDEMLNLLEDLDSFDEKFLEPRKEKYLKETRGYPIKEFDFGLIKFKAYHNLDLSYRVELTDDSLITSKIQKYEYSPNFPFIDRRNSLLPLIALDGVPFISAMEKSFGLELKDTKVDVDGYFETYSVEVKAIGDKEFFVYVDDVFVFKINNDGLFENKTSIFDKLGNDKRNQAFELFLKATRSEEQILIEKMN